MPTGPSPTRGPTRTPTQRFVALARERELNQLAGFGPVTNAIADTQRDRNVVAGRGRVTDAEWRRQNPALFSTSTSSPEPATAEPANSSSTAAGSGEDSGLIGGTYAAIALITIAACVVVGLVVHYNIRADPSWTAETLSGPSGHGMSIQNPV